MEIVLIGYPGSQKIIKASKYLASKYLANFNLNYYSYEGDIDGWSNWVADRLEELGDDEIIFALDDYLLNSPIDSHGYWVARNKLKGDVVNVKLCASTEQEHEDYPVTTQYTIWDKRFLISLLRQTTNPWDFEMSGSKLFKQTKKKAELETCMNYNVFSALSSRWSGVRLDGIKEEDLNHLKINGYL